MAETERPNLTIRPKNNLVYYIMRCDILSRYYTISFLPFWLFLALRFSIYLALRCYFWPSGFLLVQSELKYIGYMVTIINKYRVSILDLSSMEGGEIMLTKLIILPKSQSI